MLPIRRSNEEIYHHWLSRLHEDVRMKRLSLPSLPESTRRLRELVSGPQEQGLRVLAQALTQEPELATRVSKLASAAWLGLHAPGDLETAIARIGMNHVRSLVFNFCLSKLFREKQAGPLREDLKRLRQQAIRTGAAAQWLAARLMPEDANALLAGLTHNVGALPVYAMFMQQKELAGRQDLLTRMVDDVQGSLGELVLQQWGLPEAIWSVPRQVFARTPPPKHTAHGDLICLARRFGLWLEKPDSTVPPLAEMAAAERFGLSRLQLEQWLADGRAELGDWQSLLADLQ